MKSAIVSAAAFIALASAAPIATNNTAPTTQRLANLMLIDGQQTTGPAALKGPCSENDDALTCAGKTAAAWKLSATGASGTNHMTLDQLICEFNNDPSQSEYCQIDFDYHVGFTECHLSDPQITDHQDLIQCNSGGGCKETITWSTTTTQMMMDNEHVGVSIQAGVNVGFFSASATVTADWQQSWSSSNSSTTQRSIEFDMLDGDVCAPTTVQYDVQCSAGLVVGGDGTVKVTANPDPNHPHASVFYPCSGSSTVSITGGDPTSYARYQAICQAMQPTGLAMDVAAIGGGTAFAIQGCMAS